MGSWFGRAAAIAAARNNANTHSRKFQFIFSLAWGLAGDLAGGLNRPDFRQHAFEIPSQYHLDLAIGVFATDQPFGQIERPLRMVDAFDVYLVAKPVTAFVTGAQPLVFFGRHVVVAVQVNIAAHA